MSEHPYTLADFDFVLPPELIAQRPAAERSASRLLDGRSARPVDRVFRELPALLRPGDLLVFNDTKVIKARLLGRKASGGAVEALVERVLPPHEVLAHLRASKSPRPGGRIVFASAAGESFDIVLADPPPFVKSKKDLEPGAKAYRKLARLAADVTAPGGLLMVASCSHNIPPDRFAQECAQGLLRTGRRARLIRQAGAGPDHPVHPLLPESAYLKALVYALD